MLALYKKHSRLAELYFFAGLCIFSLLLSLIRVYFSYSYLFLFLNWNLILAAIPYLIVSYLSMRPDLNKKSVLVAVGLALWLLFFPNALYIFTDLFHLRNRLPVPIWFDLILILSFAWTGMLLGFKSLWDLEILLRHWFNRTVVHLASVVFLFLAAYGIYLGRFLRWNSWDLITEPWGMLYAIGNQVYYPIENWDIWGMTLLLGILLNGMYWTFYLIRRKAF